MSYECNKRWRKKHPAKWLKMKKRYYKQFVDKAYNKGQRWTTEEINLIMCGKLLDRTAANIIGRSVAAIQAERGRIKADESKRTICEKIIGAGV